MFVNGADNLILITWNCGSRRHHLCIIDVSVHLEFYWTRISENNFASRYSKLCRHPKRNTRSVVISCWFCLCSPLIRQSILNGNLVMQARALSSGACLWIIDYEMASVVSNSDPLWALIEFSQIIAPTVKISNSIDALWKTSQPIKLAVNYKTRRHILSDVKMLLGFLVKL